MDYQEAIKILAAFTEANPDLIFEKDINVVSFEQTPDKSFQIVLKTPSNFDKSILSKKMGLDKEFNFKSDKGEVSNFKITFQDSDEIIAHSVNAGTQAKHVDLMGYGTYGWGFILDGTPVALSNWHVLCPYGNNTKLGSKVLLGGQAKGTLSYFESVGDGAQNKWDMAFANFDNISDFVKSFTPCQDGLTKPYPDGMQTAKLEFGIPVYKVGARQPICREGIFIGVSNIRVNYGDNITRYFIGQLQFSKMSDPGDSGAVIVNSNSNKIIGLNFAGSDKDTFANPLFIYDGVNYLGTKFISDGIEIPIYETKNRMAKTINTTFDRESPFGSEAQIPPSLGGVYGLYSTVEIKNGMGAIGAMGGLTVNRIMDTYGVWLKVKYTMTGGGGFGPSTTEGEGWINTNAPTVLYY